MRFATSDWGPLYTLPSHVVEGGNQGTLMRPSSIGGANWSGAAVDPETGMLYVPSANRMSVVRLRPPLSTESSNLRYVEARIRTVPAMPDALPLFKRSNGAASI